MVPFSVEKQKISDGVKFFGMRPRSPKTTASNEFSARFILQTQQKGTAQSHNLYTTASSTHHYIQIELESASSTISTVNN